MNFYSHRTVAEQASRLPEAFQENYARTQLDRIILFDGKEAVEVLGYFEYSFLEEKSYVEQPVRSDDGSIAEIDNYKTFLTPRLIIKYNMMHINDYRTLMKKLKENNGIIVECYDVVEDKRVKHEMYFAPPSMPIIYQQYLMALGIQEYSIEMIGTNSQTEMIFTFDALECKAIKGMTWREWVNSDYNIYGFVVRDDDTIYNQTYNTILYQALDSHKVSPDEFVLMANYYHV